MFTRQLLSVRPALARSTLCGLRQDISCAPSIASKHTGHSNVSICTVLQKYVNCSGSTTNVVNAKLGNSIPIKRWLCSSSSDQSSDDSSEARLEVRQLLEDLTEKGVQVPTKMTDEAMEYLATLGKKKRMKYISKLVRKEQEKIIKAQKKANTLDRDAEDDSVFEATNKLVRRYNKQDFNLLDSWRVAAAMKFNPHIALDFIYDDLMNWREIRHVATQMGYLLKANKSAREPFHIHMVDFHYGGLVERELQKLFQGQFEDLLLNVTDKGLLDVFPRQKIVYLTPDSNNILTTYDPDKVYIIGALVDLEHETGASLAQAKQLNIQHCRLPLDTYLQWNVGHKSLTLDSMVNILLEQAEHGDMSVALAKHVPQRKFGGVKTNIPNFKPKSASSDNLFSSSRAQHSRKWKVEDGEFGQRSSGRAPRRFQDWGVDERSDWHKSRPRQRKY